eukprot:9123286-Pyramimonas_sp.AAC.1
MHAASPAAALVHHRCRNDLERENIATSTGVVNCSGPCTAPFFRRRGREAVGFAPRRSAAS